MKRSSRTPPSSTTSSPTASARTSFLTVTNASNHEKDFGWMSYQRRVVRRRDGRSKHRRLRDLAVQGPIKREIVQALPPSLPRRVPASGASSTARPRVVCGPVIPARTGSSSADPEDAPAGLGALLKPAPCRGLARPRHAAPGGLLPRSTATSSTEAATRSRPVLAGACKMDTGFIGAEALRRRERGAARSWPPSRSGPRHRASGQHVVGRRRGDQRHAVARPEKAIGMAYMPADFAAPGTRSRSMCAAARARPRRENRCTRPQ